MSASTGRPVPVAEAVCIQWSRWFLIKMLFARQSCQYSYVLRCLASGSRTQPRRGSPDRAHAREMSC
jgi:hypothetical protein